MAEGGLKHSYPQDLVSIVEAQWDHVPAFIDNEEGGEPCVPDSLPDSSVLEFLISACYQTSLMRDEGRPITFRLFFREPDRIPISDGPPAGLHQMVFTDPLPFDEYELRRLSPAADFYRSLIGASLDKEKGLRIWGLINSGARWVQTAHGGRKIDANLPPSLLIRVTGPGRLAVCKGPVTIVTLNSGKIALPSMEPAVPLWLLESFTPSGDKLDILHRPAREAGGKPCSVIDDAFLRILSQQVYKRIVSMMRSLHHGGTIILVPPERAAELTAPNRFLDIRYKFVSEEPRHRLRSLYMKLLNTLAGEGERLGIIDRPIGWSDYMASESSAIERLDEAIFETAQFIADLTSTDGAVVMTKSLEVVGFGAEILGGLETIHTVARILDDGGEHRQIESTRQVGTRHRSAYRICHKLHDIVVIVVSQDGMVRIVLWKDNMVAYWDQMVASVLDL